MFDCRFGFWWWRRHLGIKSVSRLDVSQLALVLNDVGPQVPSDAGTQPRRRSQGGTWHSRRFDERVMR
eukprot:6111682-Prymnesium_polylepis.1